MKNYQIVVTFVWGESRGIARYIVVPQYEGEVVVWKIRLYSISPPRSREWCPPSNWWGMAKMRENQILEKFIASKKTMLTIDTCMEKC
jgi:hypothetical protein